MAVYKLLALIVTIFLGFSNSAFVDTLTKCSIKDNECNRKLVSGILTAAAHDGVSELNIPALDPIKLKNVHIEIPNLLNLTLVEGVAVGIQKCDVNSVKSDIDHSKSIVNLTCDIIIEGTYDVQSDSQLFFDLFGGPIHGRGNGIIKAERLNIVIEYPYKVTRRNNDVFLVGNRKKFKYTWDVQGKVTFSADKLYLGKREASKEIVAIMNENWKLFVGTFGNSIFDFAMELCVDFLDKFFINVATKYYVIEDISQFIK